MIYRYERLDSTMVQAAKLADDGCPSGTVVIADEQTSGQGRLGRSWHSEPGSGIYFSQVRRDRVSADSLPVVTLALGLATAEAIAESAGVSCDLRWPNDVLVSGKKCAGILVQLQEEAFILGIGINVNHGSFPADLSGIATSLRIETGREHDRVTIVSNLIASIDRHMEMLLRTGKSAVLNAFAHASSYVRGRRVVVEQDVNLLEGTTEGLDSQGFLILRKRDGSKTLILAGGVRPACS